MPNFLAVSSEKTKMSGHRDTCSETWNAEYLKKGVIGYTIVVPDVVPDSGATKLVRRTIRGALVVYLKNLLAYKETIVVMI